ncbi:T9SS type A sorting domain-containing protein [Epilithonimonas xixisoli]|uniref:Putative secreted protein (Por secretion system target) n=1 Tax=Epilithonimonas xixisoli TaxID=1476462 RepID=A0A4R8IFH2_9FLAO|nr:T9SS type A sorting domain-containing protein [Epilithonimonas xixisoli]TDX84184.1 putative secreted protein (Por secretion system target) [Epilithonimonas xixisoli]
MRKIYSLALALMAGATAFGQLTHTVNNGEFKITYGKTADWSIYDPQGAPTIYLHVWSSQTDGDNDKGNFDDSWNNSTSTLTWDATENAYVGTVNLNTKVFSNSNNTMPAGTVVQRIGIVMKDQSNGATRQSADKDLEGPTTLTTMAVVEANGKAKSQVAAGKLFTSAKGNVDLTVFDFGGKVIKTMKVNATGTPIDLNLNQKGLYLVKISGAGVSEVVKFAN